MKSEPICKMQVVANEKRAQNISFQIPKETGGMNAEIGKRFPL